MSDIMQQLEFEYHSIKAANPEWKQSLWDFLIKRGCSPDDIWEYSPQIGWDAGQPEPDWL
ncbi:MAG: hypothetical protein GWN58_20175 [Anaerolineae bacterium]|nr:hypothetical protein [Anaerolineae bacterium]